MGDSRRFDLFAKLAEKHFKKDWKIADVACGKGYLQAAMRQRGFTNIISWDKRKKTASNRKGYRYGYFNWQCKEKYDAVIAMHPDGGTDHAILYAGKNRVPALICPCCAIGDAVAFWGQNKYPTWIKHLEKIANDRNLSIQKTNLTPMTGRRLVLILKPKKEKEK
jgi:hypothetical protein